MSTANVTSARPAADAARRGPSTQRPEAEAPGTPARPAPAAEWVIALDPASGRFRVDFPDADGPCQSEERRLMPAVAIGLDSPEFRQQVIEGAFQLVIDAASPH